MSLKKLLGLEIAEITDIEIMARIKQADMNNQDYCEFDIEGEKIRIGIPHIQFDPNSDDRDSW